jgi:hypothetical protein
MTHACIKAGAALLVLGGFAVATPAHALSPFPLDGNLPVFIPIQDEENEEVWKDLRPDVAPPEAAVGNEAGEAAKEEMKERPKEEGPGNTEEKELQEEGMVPE